MYHMLGTKVEVMQFSIQVLSETLQTQYTFAMFSHANTSLSHGPQFKSRKLKRMFGGNLFAGYMLP